MNGSYAMEVEQVWVMVERVRDTFSLAMIARGFSGHDQIVNAISQWERHDDFIQEKNGLHCSVRKIDVLQIGGLEV